MSQSAAQTLTASVGIHLANLTTGILVARVLQATGRGELAVIQLCASIAAAISLIGLDQASIYFISKAEPGARSVIMWRGIRLSLCAAGILSFATLFISGVVPGIGALNAPMRVIVATYIPINNIAVICVATLLAVGATKYWNICRASVHYFILIFTTLLFVAGLRSATSAALALLAGNFCTIVVAAWLLRRSVEDNLPDKDGASNLGELLNYGARVHGTTLFRLVAERADQVAVALLLGTRALGLYVVALTLLRATTGMMMSLEQLAFRALISAKAERSRGLVSVLVATLVCGFLLSGVLWLMIPIIVRIAFGLEFLDAIESAQILAWALPPILGRLLLGALLKSRNAPLLATTVDLFALIGLVATLTLVTPQDLEGISHAVVWSSWIGLLAGGIFASLRLRLNPVASLRDDIKWISQHLTRGHD